MGKEAPVCDVNYIVMDPTNFADVPTIRIDQFDSELLDELQPYLHEEVVMQACHLLSYLVWRNVNYFNYRQKANIWKMNRRDYKNMMDFCTNLSVYSFNHTIYVADIILDKAMKAQINLYPLHILPK